MHLHTTSTKEPAAKQRCNVYSFMLLPASHTAFLTWCHAQARIANPHHLALQGVEGERRVVATCDIPASTPTSLLQTPLSCCLVADSQAGLADRLIYEQGLADSSLWAPYLQLLPTLDALQRQLPRFWSPLQLERIPDGGFVQAAVTQLCQDQAHDKVDPWAMAVVRSRCNYLIDSEQTNNKPPRLSLTPFLDMMNHDPAVRTQAKIINDEHGASDLVVTTPDTSWTAHQEVCISYGNLTNLETLVDYGFVATDNPCNQECVEVKTIYRSSPIPVTIHADGIIDDISLAPLRQALATKDERRQVEEKESATAYLEPISSRNEMEVDGLVSATLYNALDQMQDGAARPPHDTASSLIQRYVLERSKVLENAMQRIDRTLEG